MSESSGETKRNFQDRLATIRHDLRTPVGHIIGYAEMLEEELEGESLPASFAGHLKKLKHAGRQVLELIDELLSPANENLENLDLPGARKKLSVPLTQVSGSCDHLVKQAQENERRELLPDIEKISTASRDLLRMLESRLTPAFFESPREAGRAQPAAAAEPGKPLQAAFPPGPTGLGEGGEILVVDDNPETLELLERQLRRQGYSPSPVSSGAGALKHLAENRVELILLDMRMPGMSGLDVLKHVKADKALRNIPVIMLSALDQVNTIVESIQMGAEDYLFKPYKPVLLKARISAVLEKIRLRRHAAPRLKIFISSPSDVVPERRILKGVLQRLNEELAGRVHLVPVLWEEEPLVASETAQSQILRPRDTDIYVGVFWARMGTMLPENITRPDGTRYGSGSEFEFEDALDGYNKAGRPDILVYRKLADPVVSLSNKAQVLECLEQRELLEGFLKNWFLTKDGQSIARVYHVFETGEELEATALTHLRKLVLKRLEGLDRRAPAESD